MNAFEKLSLASKVAVVTGATRGIGQAIAEGLASAGADIVGVGRSSHEETEASVKAYGRRYFSIRCGVDAEDAPESIAEKTSLLLRHQLALWDVIANCEIDGSADASVREAVPVDITRITDRAHITRVLCNGKLAGTLYARHLQPIMGIPALVLPSTSPANAVWTLPKLTDAWRKALTDENATFCE